MLDAASSRGRFALTDKPADEYLPWNGHVTDNVVLLEDGSHLAIIRLDGRPLLLNDDRGRYAIRRARHSVLRALADTRVMLYEHHVCHDRVEPFRLGKFRSEYSRSLAHDYHDGLTKNLLAREWFMTIMVKPSPLTGLINMFRRGKNRADEDCIRLLEEKVSSTIHMLRHYHPVRLGTRWSNGVPFSEIGEAIRLVLYARFHPVPITTGTLAGSVYTDRVICGQRGFEVLGPDRSNFGVLWGFRDYPEVTRPMIMDGVLTADCRLVMTNSFRFKSTASASDRMSLTQRRMTTANDRAVSLNEGLDDAIDDLQSGRKIMGDHHWSLAVHANSMKELDKAVGSIKSMFANTSNLAVTTEAVGCFAAYWAQVPGAPAVVRARHGDISGFNFCSFSSLGGFPSGRSDVHWRPVMRVLTQGRTAHDFSPHVRRVGHTVLIGPTGFGKSVTMGLFDTNLEPALYEKGGLSVIFDKDGSNEISILARNGYYVRIRRGMDSGQAPLKALEDIEEDRNWLAGFIVSLIMDDGGSEPPPDQLEKLRTGIAFIMRRQPAMRTIAGLRMFLDHGKDSTGGRLEKWCRGGSLGWVFDGEEDRIRTTAGVVGIDNTEILPDDMSHVRQPSAAYQFYRVRKKIGRGVRGAVYVDEGASYLPDSRFAEGFDAFSRELRKGNGMLWFAVHHPEDLINHPSGKALLANSPTKLLFPNPYANEDAYSEHLKCSRGELDAILSGMLEMGEGTFMVKRPDGSFIARAPIMKPEHIAVLSSDPLRSALWHKIAQELGTTDGDKIWAIYRNRYHEATA